MLFGVPDGRPVFIDQFGPVLHLEVLEVLLLEFVLVAVLHKGGLTSMRVKIQEKKSLEKVEAL